MSGAWGSDHGVTEELDTLRFGRIFVEPQEHFAAISWTLVAFEGLS